MIQLNLEPPKIEKYSRSQGGVDNQGIGWTQFGERYLLKTNREVCVAEHVGAILCTACGIPVAQPSVVDFKGHKVFGSRLESGVTLPQNPQDVIDQVSICLNPSVFSAVLAIDLALGNNDRHWHNWLPQPQDGSGVILRAVDFSRSWPTQHPPCTFESMRAQHTGQVWLEWPVFGISFDLKAAQVVCDRILTLTDYWLAQIFAQLPVEWMVTVHGPELCKWWRQNWVKRVKEVKGFLESGAWT